MLRRPYIQDGLFPKDEFVPTAHPNDGYSQSPINKEPVGQKRSDWFRCNCRECGQKMITRRNEKLTRYFNCPDCNKLHHVSGGFFPQPDRKIGHKTVPLRQNEVDGILCRAWLDYTETGIVSPSWTYGRFEWLRDRIESDRWTLRDTSTENETSTRTELYDPGAKLFEVVGDTSDEAIASYIESVLD